MRSCAAGSRVRLLVLLWVGFGLSAPAPASEAESCAVESAARIQRRYEAVRDLKARFEQTTRSITLGNSPLAGSEATSGTVVFAKPGRMRWSYEKPAPSLVVSDGSTLWLYDPEAREAQRLTVSEGYLSGAALQFLLGEGNLLEAFEIEAVECGAQRVVLDLKPRADASYERLGLVARRDSGDVLESTIVDLFGNETRVVFEDMQTNTGPDPALFRFEPPRGVRVIDLAPSS